MNIDFIETSNQICMEEYLLYPEEDLPCIENCLTACHFAALKLFKSKFFLYPNDEVLKNVYILRLAKAIPLDFPINEFNKKPILDVIYFEYFLDVFVEKSTELRHKITYIKKLENASLHKKIIRMIDIFKSHIQSLANMKAAIKANQSIKSIEFHKFDIRQFLFPEKKIDPIKKLEIEIIDELSMELCTTLSEMEKLINRSQ